MAKTTDDDDKSSCRIVKDGMIEVERCYTPFTKVELHIPRLIDYLKFDGVFSIKIMT